MRAFLFSIVPLALVSCAVSPETVAIRAYGEPFIEEGIAADEMDDGWAIAFSSFEVEVLEAELGGILFEPSGPVELARNSQGKGHELGSISVPEGTYTDGGFVLGAIHAVGVATKGRDTKHFDWRFDNRVRYSSCESEVLVKSGQEASFQITVHADHLFYDSIVAEEPGLKFQALADADEDGDGEITVEELERADIGSYDPGSSGDIDDLWSYLEALTLALGHADGEGHCEAHLEP